MSFAMQELSADREDRYAHECRVRDVYAHRLAEFRPDERLLATEHSYAGTRVRGDMRTLDRHDVIRIWEFEIAASYEGLGQALTYLALARKELNFNRPVRGVLAAFEIQSEIQSTVELLNLGIELVIIPDKLRLAGDVPWVATTPVIPQIPPLTTLLGPSTKES